MYSYKDGIKTFSTLRSTANHTSVVRIDEPVYEKIMHWINKAGSNEISGFGKVQVVDDVLLVTSAVLLKQENSAFSTEIDAAALGKAMFALKDEPGAMNWWWHSHANMDVFWSRTDLDTIKEIGANGWCLATVFNNKAETRSAYYQKGNDFIPSFFVDNMTTEHRYIMDEGELILWDKEFTDNISLKKLKYNEHDPYDLKDLPSYRKELDGRSWKRDATSYEVDRKSWARTLDDIEYEDYSSTRGLYEKIGDEEDLIEIANIIAREEDLLPKEVNLKQNKRRKR